jgi:hypothetical protein
MRARSWLLLVGVIFAACSDSDDEIRADVRLLCNHEGALAVAAADNLTRFGRRAIPTVEAAMHTASVPGRKNLVLALRRIGDGEAAPLLGHIAVWDGSAEVKREAEWTLKQWAADDKASARAARAKQALRAVEEARGVEDAG